MSEPPARRARGAWAIPAVLVLAAHAVLVGSLRGQVSPCGAPEAEGLGGGEVAGTVAEKASAVPLAGAQVIATWVDPVVSEVVERQVSADEAGRYRLCGPPVEVDLTLQAEALSFYRAA